MSYTYNYNIALNIPGGSITIDNISYLTNLIQSNIATSLIQVAEITSGTLSVVFAQQLTVPEKTLLDNNTLDPAGGFINLSADYIEVNVDSAVINNFDIVEMIGDGLEHKAVILYHKDGSGQLRLGTTAEISITSPGGIIPINTSFGNFDPLTALFEFDILPTENRFRGQRSVLIVCNGLPSRAFLVKIL